MFPSLLQPLNEIKCIRDDVLEKWKEIYHKSLITSIFQELQINKNIFFGRRLTFNEKILIPFSFYSLLQVYLHDTITNEYHSFWKNGIYFISGVNKCIFWFSHKREYINICIKGTNPWFI
jgi:hypothetical protein